MIVKDTLALRLHTSSLGSISSPFPQVTERHVRTRFLLPLWRKARRVSRIASWLLGTTCLRFHGTQRMFNISGGLLRVFVLFPG